MELTSYVKVLYLLFIFVSAARYALAGSDCIVKGKNGVIKIKQGQTASLPGKCAIATCQQHDTVTVKTCPARPPKPGCKLSNVDYSKDFPDCCPQDVC